VADPILSQWLEEAARLPGKSLHIGFALLRAVEQAKSQKVPLNNVSGRCFGLGRFKISSSRLARRRSPNFG
jgi:hypothetical protein